MQPDMQDLARQIGSIQDQLRAVHGDLVDAEVVGTSGNGLVRVTMSAAGEFRSVRIDPAAVDPTDTHRLEVLVLAALRDGADAIRRLTADIAQQLKESAARLGLPGS